MKAGRELNENNFVDVNFCMERLKGTCQKCGGDFHIEIKKGALSSNFTCQRVDNNVNALECGTLQITEALFLQRGETTCLNGLVR